MAEKLSRKIRLDPLFDDKKGPHRIRCGPFLFYCALSELYGKFSKVLSSCQRLPSPDNV